MPNPMKRPAVQQNQGYRSNNQIASEAATLNTNPSIGAGQAGIMDFPAKGQIAPRMSNQTQGNINLSTLKGAAGDISATLPKKMGYKANAVADLAMGDTTGAVTNLAKTYVPGVSMASRAVDVGKRLGSGDATGALLEGAGAVVPVVPDLINAGRDIIRDVNQRSIENNNFNQRNREVRGSLQCRNTGVVDSDGSVFVNSEDTELLGKLGYVVEDYASLEKTSEVMDVYSYIEKIAGVPKEVAKLVDSGKAFSAEYLKDMKYNIPEGYEVKGDLCCPMEKDSAERPGLWANIHAKRKRGEKAAKPGDEDYPDREQWDKLSKEGAPRYQKEILKMSPDKAREAIKRMALGVPEKTVPSKLVSSPSKSLLMAQLVDDANMDVPSTLLRLKETMRDMKAFKERAVPTGRIQELTPRQRAARFRDLKAKRKGDYAPTQAETHGIDPETELPFIHGGGENFLKSFLERKNKGYRLENDPRKGIQVHGQNPGVASPLESPEVLKRTDLYANSGAVNNFDTPAKLTGRVKAKHLLNANNDYEHAIADPSHIIDPVLSKLPVDRSAISYDKSLLNTLTPLRKEAMTLSATKNLLRKFRAAGGKLTRTHPIGAAYDNAANEIQLSPRGVRKSPVSDLWHEYGHFLDRDAVNKYYGAENLAKRTDAQILRNPATILEFENRANTNAIDAMRKARVPQSLRDAYIKARSAGFDSYRSQVGFEGVAKKYLDNQGFNIPQNFNPFENPEHMAIFEKLQEVMAPVGRASVQYQMSPLHLQQGTYPYKAVARPLLKQLRKTDPAYDKAFRQYHGEFKEPLSLPVAGPSPLAKQAASAAWQRSEGKNPEGGLNAKGRASYKKQTGGTLKAPVTESNPSGERAKRQNSFCSRMCGMKRKNTGSKGQSDPDSRINKSLRKWNCKCGEDHSSLFEKIACTLGSSEKTAAGVHSVAVSRGSQNTPPGVTADNLFGTVPTANPETAGTNKIKDKLISDKVKGTLIGTIPVSRMGKKLLGGGVSAFSNLSDMSQAAQRWKSGDKRPAIVQGIGATADMLATPIALTGIGAPVAGLLKGVSMGAAGALAKHDAKVDVARDLKARREFLKNRTNQYPQEITGLISSPPPQNQIVTQPQVNQKQGSLWELLKKAKGRCWEGYEPVPGKEAYSEDSCRPKTDKKKEEKKAEANVPLKSSNIRAVGHDKKSKKLDVAFQSGSEYQYSDVPRSLYSRLLKAKSHGKFFHKHIKKDNKYPYEKVAEYKWHNSKDLHRDVTNGRHYPFSFLTGEAKELIDAVKNRDMANFKEEIGDTTYAAQMLAAQATGLNHPVYADLSKFYNREKVWKDMFKSKGSTYHPKHMEGGSNFAKPSKIIKAFASAGINISQREAERLANKHTGGKMEKGAGFKGRKGKISVDSQNLLPGMSEQLGKQPFNHAENAFARGRISKALRDSILSGQRAEELRPAFEKMLEHIRNIR